MSTCILNHNYILTDENISNRSGASSEYSTMTTVGVSSCNVDRGTSTGMARRGWIQWMWKLEAMSLIAKADS